MRKKIFISIIALLLLITVFFLLSQRSKHESSNVLTAALKENICKEVKAKIGDCQRILLYDADSHLVFVESSFDVVPVLIDKNGTDLKKIIYPTMDFQEFKEEKTEIGPIDWRVSNNVQRNFSIAYGFVDKDIKTIVINSEGNKEPKRFPIRDDLSGWYFIKKDKIKTPLEVTAKNSKGQILEDENQED